MTEPLPAVKDFKEGTEIEAILWLVSGAVRQTRTGDPYWEGSFRDATGSIPGKLWDSMGSEKGRVKSLAPKLAPGAAYKVRAKVESYKELLQLTLLSAKPTNPREADPGLFSPRSTRPAAEMAAEFDALAAGMADPHFKALLQALRSDEETFRLFSGAPAAKAIHHPWVGGLIEHSLGLARSSRALAASYPYLDLDLILAGCVFHDLGKIHEISSDPGFEYTTDGKLMGHIYMGARLAESYMDGIPNFPEEKRRHLVHLILSHQGERSLGFGSPADPATPEAIFFHHLDNLDAKLQNCLSALEKAGEAGESGEFTSERDSGMRRGYYRRRPSQKEQAQRHPKQLEAQDDQSGQPKLW